MNWPCWKVLCVVPMDVKNEPSLVEDPLGVGVVPFLNQHRCYVKRVGEAMIPAIEIRCGFELFPFELSHSSLQVSDLIRRDCRFHYKQVRCWRDGAHSE